MIIDGAGGAVGAAGADPALDGGSVDARDGLDSLVMESRDRMVNLALFSAASVGIPAAMFLPLRLGELVRPAMIARAGVPFPGAQAEVHDGQV